MRNYVDISEFVGKTFTEIWREDREYDGEALLFQEADGTTYMMYHDQDCCESVSIEDICGELSFLLDSPILEAEEVTKDGETEWGSETWTFYHINTAKGYVTLRWYGESNGYYSESVSLVRLSS